MDHGQKINANNENFPFIEFCIYNHVSKKKNVKYQCLKKGERNESRLSN